jgi:CxxC motif-containing protein
MSDIKMVCISCPIGCRLTLVKDDNEEKGYKVLGNHCARGIDYALEEMTAPKRMVPTTVVIKNAHLRRLPVRTEKPIPKELIFDCMKEVNKVIVTAPVKVGDVLIENVCGTDVNVIATRSMDEYLI